MARWRNALADIMRGGSHFGKVFLHSNDRLQYAPREIMNAVYISPFTTLTGTDTASFCSIWASRQ